MKYFEKYDSTKTYMFPNGAIATPAVVTARYPAVGTFTHIVETDESGEVIFALQNLAAMRTLYSIDSTLSEADAITAIQTAINTDSEDTTVSTDERIAAALEFLAVSSLDDTTTE